MDEKQLQLPHWTIITIVAGFMILLGSGLAIYLTVTPKIATVQKELDTTAKHLQVARNLYPIYSRLLSLLEKQKDRVGFDYSPKRIPLKDITTFEQRIHTVSEKTGMQCASVRPRPETIQADKDRILVAVVLQGEFVDFRKFLLQLLAFPCLIGVEQIQISSIPENREYNLSLWVHFT